MDNYCKQSIYSSEDLEKFYLQHQIESLTHGESLQLFCLRNKVLYNIFQKWYKDIRKKVVEVQVDGFPSGDKDDKLAGNPQKAAIGPAAPIRIWVDIWTAYI